jgi:hypothetical protein
MCFFLDSPASAGMFLNVCFSFPNDHQWVSALRACATYPCCCGWSSLWHIGFLDLL